MENSMAGSDPAQDLGKRLAEPYAFALLTWPAVLGLLVAVPDEWADPLRIAIWLWLGAIHLAAYGGGRGAGFGNAVLLMSGLVAACTTTFPSPWALAWLPPLLAVLLAAQRMRIRSPARNLPGVSPTKAAH